MGDVLLAVFGLVCIALLSWVAHLFVSDYEDTMSEIRKLDDDDEVLLDWLGGKDD